MKSYGLNAEKYFDKQQLWQCFILLLQRRDVAEPLAWNGTVPIPGESASLERRRLAPPPGWPQVLPCVALRRTVAMPVCVLPRCRTPNPAHGWSWLS